MPLLRVRRRVDAKQGSPIRLVVNESLRPGEAEPFERRKASGTK